MKPVRVGVVGFGLSGRIFHAAVVSAVEGLELAAIVQRSGKTATETYPHVRVVSTVGELLSDSSIRLIVVATPNSSHASVAHQCLMADRDVVIDKPFALDSSEAADLIRLAHLRKRLLTVYHNRRWDGDFRTVCKLLAGQPSEEAPLGRLVQFESHFDRFRPQPKVDAWRESGVPGGGILLDLGSHLVDQAMTLFGLPQSIWADVRVERDGGKINDAFDLNFRYPSPPEADREKASPAPLPPPLTVWLRATCLARDPGARFTLHGTRGSYRKFGLDPQEDALRSGDLFASSPWGMEAPEQWGTMTSDKNGRAVSQRIPTEAGDYRAFYANVRDALVGEAPLEVTPLQAWRTMRALEMCLASSRSGCTVICDWTQKP